MVSLPERRRAVTYLRSQHAVSERRACEVLSMHRSSYRHEGTRRAVDAVHGEVVRLSERYPYWGYRKIYDLIERERFPVGRERVRLIRRREGLQVVQKRRKRRVLGSTTAWVHRAERPRHVWSYDFVFDATADARSLKFLTVVDEFTREGLAVHCGSSLTSTDVIRLLGELVGRHGAPECIRSDNGPEFIAEAVKDWLADRAIGTHFIDPGSPWQNAYNESFNSIFRTTCLDRWLFESVSEARAVTTQWLEEYNTIRPHGSLGGRTPVHFAQAWTDAHRRQINDDAEIPNLESGPRILG
jgi:putative transposase